MKTWMKVIWWIFLLVLAVFFVTLAITAAVVIKTYFL